MFFKEVIGQDAIKEKFLQTVREERVSHAQLLSGEEGFGSLPLALAFAQYILCENRGDQDSCGTCPSCEKVRKLIHPDLHFVFPVTTTAKITKPTSDDFITEWREALLEDPYISAQRWYQKLGIENKLGVIYTHESNEIIKKLNLKTFEAEYKVMVIWQPERMHVTCSNKLLKIIEEPPPKTLFLMASVFPDQLIATFLSRMQHTRIPAINEETLSDGLSLKYGIDKKEAEQISRLANGSVTRAQEYYHEGEDLEKNMELFIQWMRLCYGKEMGSLLNWVDEVAALGRERKKAFLLYSMRMMRENYLMNAMKDHTGRLNKLTRAELGFSEKFSAFVKEKNIPNLYKEINKAIADIESNAYARTVLLDLSIKIMGQLK